MYPSISVNGSNGKVPPKNHQNPPSFSKAPADNSKDSQQKSSKNSKPLNENQVNYIKYPVAFGPVQTKVVCPSCDKKVETKVKYEADKMTHLNAILLGICTFFLCCCCIPYCAFKSNIYSLHSNSQKPFQFSTYIGFLSNRCQHMSKCKPLLLQLRCIPWKLFLIIALVFVISFKCGTTNVNNSVFRHYFVVMSHKSTRKRRNKNNLIVQTNMNDKNKRLIKSFVYR